VETEEEPEAQVAEEAEASAGTETTIQAVDSEVAKAEE